MIPVKKKMKVKSVIQKQVPKKLSIASLSPLNSVHHSEKVSKEGGSRNKSTYSMQPLPYLANQRSLNNSYIETVKPS
jgi:hypothetical protein